MEVDPKRQRAKKALNYIIPILKKFNFRWCISGSFACYLYGVKRPIAAIDIDVETYKDDPAFKRFIKEVEPFTQLPFQLWIDKNYDNWVMDVVFEKQLLSICTTSDLKLLNKKSQIYELYYKQGIPEPLFIDFEGIALPVAPKESVLKMKEALAHKKAVDRVDISGMQKLLDKS
ncbi:MAG: hypothetical protein O3B47_05670 [bacterium]|nr:hypothetical protein [bacterium]